MKRLRTKLTAMTLACAGLVAAPPAKADPGTVAVVLSSFMAVETAVAVTVALYTYGAYVLTGYAIYGSIQARNKAKRAAAAARAAYNAGLQDRAITALTAAPLRRVVYGRCDTGGDLVAMFTTDKTVHGPGWFRGVEISKPDAFKHLIIVWAAHQCQAVHDIKIDGIPVGALDADGWATGDEWTTADPRPNGYGQIAGNLRSQTLPGDSTIISVTLISGSDGSTHTPIANGAGGWSFSGTTLTLPNSVTVAGFAHTPDASDIWDIAYSADDNDGTSTIRVRHHLGSPTQAADAELMALLPDKWTANHRLRGRCYSWITLDLQRAQFQGGPPGITADVSGALVLDPRTSVTAWSANPALCAYDYLRRVEGMNVTSAEVDVASVIAAANDCDVSTSFTIGGSTVTGPLYTCNGAFMAGPAREAVLIDICESMAGFHTYSGSWRVLSGSWTPPVMDLDDNDLHGSISIVQSGEPSGELFNSVRGQYVPAGSAVAADIETYSNPTFVAADRGKQLFTDIELPFTNSRARAKNISRIKVEQNRAGLVIFFPAKLRAWPLQTGDRVRVTSAEYGFSAKLFRVTDWQFGLRSPVGLTLQEDAADIYDLADAALADPTPNTDLPSPWFVAPITSATAASGTAQLQRLGDGTIISRVLVTWPVATAAYMEGGRIELAWREAGGDTTHYASANDSDAQAYLANVRDGAFIAISLTAINSLGARSAPVTIGHLVQGKQVAPAAVQGLAATVVPGALKVTRTPSTEADYDFTLYRYGASWAAGTPVPGQADRSGITWDWPAPGTYTIWAADVDTTRHIGTPVSTSVTVDSSILIGTDESLPPVLRPNLLQCGGFEKGLDAWSGPQIGSFAPYNDFGYGRYIATAAIASGTDAIKHEPVPAHAGEWYTVHGDAALQATSGQVYFDVLFLDSGGAVIYDGPQSPRSASFDFGVDDTTRRVVAVEAQAPAGTAFAVARFVWVSLVGCTQLGVRMVKLERGRLPFTTYSAEAALGATTSDALAAQTAADAAADEAQVANESLAIMRSNGYLDAAEKPAVIKDWLAIAGERAGLVAEANRFFIVTERDAYTAAYTALQSYLVSLAPAWDDTTLNTVINPITDQEAWSSYYSARQALLNRIAAITAGRLQSRANLVPNGGFESGLAGWDLGSSGLAVDDGPWGRTLQRVSGFGGTGAITSSPFAVAAGATYTITGDSLLFAASGQVSFDLLYFDASNALLLDGANAPLGPHDFSDDDTHRVAHAVASVAPSGAVTAKARFVWEGVVGGTALGARKIKVERGALPATAYTPDTSLLQAIAAAATAQTTADGKITSFHQDSPPSGQGEDEGDLWFDTNDGSKQYRYTTGVWVLAADTRIGDAIAAAANAQTTANSKTTTFYGGSTPTALAVGDLWSNNTAGSTRLSRWNGSAWVVLSVIGNGDVDTAQLVPGAATTLAEVLIGSVDITGTSVVGAPNSYSASYNLLGTVTFTPKVTGVANLYLSANLKVSSTLTASGPYNALVFVGVNVDQDSDGVAEDGDGLGSVEIRQYLTAGMSISWASPIAGRVQVSTVAGVSRTLNVYGYRNGDPATCTLTNLRLGVEGINA